MSIENLRFGVELEIVLPRGVTRSSAAAAITAAGVLCREENYGHGVPRNWKVTTDGSIGYDNGEFVSPPLQGEEGYRQLALVCDTLRNLGATVDQRCGFHVHVDAAGASLDFFKSLARVYAKYEPVIDSVLSRSRRGSNNHYCKSTARVLNEPRLSSATDVRSVVAAVAPDRFMKLNLHSWFRQGTVEFRQHQGTTDAAKAVNWVKLCQRMVAAATKMAAASPAPAITRPTRDRHLHTVVEMLTRPEGTTREEIMQATGQRGARIPRRSQEAGLIVVRRRRANQVRFYATRPTAQHVAMADFPVTLPGFLAMVEAPAGEAAFFTMRAEHLARI